MCKPIKTIDGNDLWFSEDDDAQGSGGYYWQQGSGYTLTSDESYHNIGDAVRAMTDGEVTFDGDTNG